MNFIDDGIDEEWHKNINRTIIDGNVMNISLIIMEGNYGAIDADDSTRDGYYIIRFFYLHIPFNQNLVYTSKSFLLVKWYLREFFPNKYQL